MNAAIEQFRAKMREIGYTDDEITADIRNAVRHARMNRRYNLIDELEHTVHGMTNQELLELKNEIGGAA